MRRRVLALVLALASALSLQSWTPERPAYSDTGDLYVNPAGGDFGPVFPDPSVIRGRDGYWYGYATVAKLSDPDRHQLPIIRSENLTTWEYVGDVFDGTNWPTWSDPRQPLWAPEAQYYNGRYYIYYTVVNSPAFPRPNFAIGVATAPTPAGPFTDLGEPIVAPRWWEPLPGVNDAMTVIDPEVVTAPTGERYLYYGSFRGGIFAARLTDDGLRTTGEHVKIASERRFEGAYLVHRDGFYYLFASAAGCCLGPVTGYTVYVSRSRTPLGPFVDRHGVPVLGARAGGTPVVAPNGNRWVGTGHNAVVTDLSGQDWMAYHAYDRHDPYLGPPVPHRRALLIDRLDWVDGWPVVRGGRFASDTPQPAPVVDALVADAFESDTVGSAWEPRTPGWSVRREAAGGHLQGEPGASLSAVRAVDGDLRIRGAVRLADGDAGGDAGGDANGDSGAAGFVLAGDGDGGEVRVRLDRAAGALVVTASRGAQQASRSAALPDGFRYPDWHEIDIERRGDRVVAKVSDAGLYDPVAEASVDLPPGLDAGRLTLTTSGAEADFDDVTVARLYQPQRALLPDPAPGVLDPAASDDFSDGLDPAWSWIRGPAAEVSDGHLVFPLQDEGFFRTSNNASLLVRDVPQDEWTVETRVELDFADEVVEGTPQAGMFAYVDDDHYVRLMTVGQERTRRTELAKEMPFEEQLVAGSAWIGPPGAESTWLRLQHRIDPATGEHVLRAGTSPDGEHWTWGAAYTLPGDATVRLALGAFGGAGRTARFDHVRLYRP